MFILISALMLPFTLNAQTARDKPDTQGANTEDSALDSEKKARVQKETSDREEGRSARGPGR